jgi:hypothetical protein
MTDHAPSKPYVWKNPLAVWGTASGNSEAPSIRAAKVFRDLAEPRPSDLESHEMVADAAQSSQHQGPLQSKDGSPGKEDP